jgi:hypothetical protein
MPITDRATAAADFDTPATARPARYLGIDPGLGGWAAIVDGDGKLVGTWPTPTLPHPTEPTRRVYDRHGMLVLIHKIAGPGIDGVAIEKQHVMPRNGALAGYASGFGYAMWLGLLLAGAHLDPLEVASQTWKKHHGVLPPPIERRPGMPLADPQALGAWHAQKPPKGAKKSIMRAWKKARPQPPAAEQAEWEKLDRKHKAGRRDEGARLAVQKVQELHPMLDLRVSPRSSQLSTDKAVAVLLAHFARDVARALPRG